MNSLQQYITEQLVCEGKSFNDIKKGDFIVKLMTDSYGIKYCVGCYKVKRVKKTQWDPKSRTSITYINPNTKSEKTIDILNTNMQKNKINDIYSDSDVAIQSMYNSLEELTREKHDIERSIDKVIDNIKNSIRKCQDNI